MSAVFTAILRLFNLNQGWLVISWYWFPNFFVSRGHTSHTVWLLLCRACLCDEHFLKWSWSPFISYFRIVITFPSGLITVDCWTIISPSNDISISTFLRIKFNYFKTSKTDLFSRLSSSMTCFCIRKERFFMSNFCLCQNFYSFLLSFDFKLYILLLGLKFFESV